MKHIYSAITEATRSHIHSAGFTKVLFGLSGGIDSALVAAIAADAFGAENVTGVMMPSRYSSGHSVTDSEELAQNLGISTITIEIEEAHQVFLELLAPALGDLTLTLTEQNLQARIRAVILMAISNQSDALVLTTSNKSESSVGYTTLYGDSVGAYAPIVGLYKKHVYEVCRWLNSRGSVVIPNSIIEKAPSAELAPEQRDDQSLLGYDKLDSVLYQLIDEEKTVEEVSANSAALGVTSSDVERIAQLVRTSAYKRAQSPPGPTIKTPKP